MTTDFESNSREKIIKEMFELRKEYYGKKDSFDIKYEGMIPEIIILEDNPLISTLEKTIIEEIVGAKAIEAGSDSVKVMSNIRKETAGIIIDLNLENTPPDLKNFQGADLYKIITSFNNDNYLNINTLIVTADSFEDTLKRFPYRNNLPFNHLEKPFKKNVFKEKVINLIKQWQSYCGETYDKRTGAIKADKINDLGANALAYAKRKEEPFSVLFMDLDNFKAVNDTYGHEAGNIVLENTANMIRHNIRREDTLSRYGGEEFLLLLPNSNFKNAYRLGERIREALKKIEIKKQQNGIIVQKGITVSQGIMTYLPGTTPQKISFNQMTSFADIMMYKAKNEGKDRCCNYDLNNYEKELKILLTAE